MSASTQIQTPGNVLWTPLTEAVAESVPWEKAEELQCNNPDTTADFFIQSPPKNFLKAAGEYRRATMTLDSLSYGSQHMLDATTTLVNEMMPIDDWLLSRGMGVNHENILVGKLAFYGALVVVAAIFLPGSVLLGVMMVGLGSGAFHYGKGFYDYTTATMPFEQQLAITRGQEAFAEVVIGSGLMIASQGAPLLANARWISLPVNVAEGLQRTARAICLADDPYFIQLTAKQGVSLISPP